MIACSPVMSAQLLKTCLWPSSKIYNLNDAQTTYTHLSLEHSRCLVSLAQPVQSSKFFMTCQSMKRQHDCIQITSFDQLRRVFVCNMKQAKHWHKKLTCPAYHARSNPCASRLALDKASVTTCKTTQFFKPHHTSSDGNKFYLCSQGKKKKNKETKTKD